MSTSDKRSFKVFISYHREDDLFKSLTDIAKSAVEQCNKDVPEIHLEWFIDDQGIIPGDDWKAVIDKNLKDTDILLPFITEGYCLSEECRYEFNTFPNVRHTCLPVFWHSVQQISNVLTDGQNDQEAQQVFQEACRRNGISTIASDVRQMVRDGLGSSVFDLRKQIIILNIAKQLKALAGHINELSSADSSKPAEDTPILSTPDIPQVSDISSAPTTPTATAATGTTDEIDETNEPDGTNQSSPIFHLRTKRLGTNAQAQLIDGVFTVLQGSITVAQLNVKKGSDLESSSRARATQTLFDRYYGNGALVERKDGRTAALTRDIQFTSPSAAAGFVLGRASVSGTTGHYAWRTNDGGKSITYSEWADAAATAAGEIPSDDINDANTEHAKQSTKHSGKTAARANAEKEIEKTEVRVDDDTMYSTIAKACNTVFGTNYVASPYKGYFHPATLHDRTVEGYESDRIMAWFPKLTMQDGNVIMTSKDRDNELVHEDDGTYIYQTDKEGTVTGTNSDDGIRSVTFGRFVDPETGKFYYRFIGVFRKDGITVHNGKASYRSKLVADSFPIIKD